MDLLRQSGTDRWRMDTQPQYAIVYSCLRKAKGATLGTHLGSLSTFVPLTLGIIVSSVVPRFSPIVLRVKLVFVTLAVFGKAYGGIC